MRMTCSANTHGAAQSVDRERPPADSDAFLDALAAFFSSAMRAAWFFPGFDMLHASPLISQAA